MGSLDQWGVSVLSNSPHDGAVVTSMLNLLRASTGDCWIIVEPEKAHFLLIASGMTVSALSGTTAPRVTAQLLEIDEPALGGAGLLIRRPLRAMPFLELLQEVDSRLRELAIPLKHFPADVEPIPTLSLSEGTTEVLTPPTWAPSDSTALGAPTFGVQPPQALGWCLHSARKGSNSSTIVLIDRDGSELAAINVARASFASVYPLDELVLRIQTGFRKAEMRALSAWDSFPGGTPLALDLLCWNVGKIIGTQAGLAPWLNGDQAYRVISWPDFGVIGLDRVGMKLSAHLAQKCLTAQQLSSVSGVDLGAVFSFLNSTSLCGLLVAGPAKQPFVRSASAAELPQQRSMFTRLRTKLGL